MLIGYVLQTRAGRRVFPRARRIRLNSFLRSASASPRESSLPSGALCAIATRWRKCDRSGMSVLRLVLCLVASLALVAANAADPAAQPEIQWRFVDGRALETQTNAPVLKKVLTLPETDLTSQNGSTGSESLGDQERDQTMKGKRHTTEEEIRALREADGGKPIREVCQERNLSEATAVRIDGGG